MSIPDEAMGEYYRLLLEPRLGAAASLSEEDLQGSAARDAKRRLARELVAWLHSEQSAAESEREWDRVFGQGELPEAIEDAVLPAGETVHLPALIAGEFGLSRSDARRLLEQGGVWLGSEQLGADDQDLAAARAEGQVLRVGKRRFRRLRAAGQPGASSRSA